MNSRTTFLIAIMSASLALSMALIPAFALQKEETVISFNDEFDVDATVCGVASNFHISSTGSSYLKTWYNGDYKVYSQDLLVITDNNNDDAIVFTSKSVGLNHGNDLNLPTSFLLDPEGECFDDAEENYINVEFILHGDGRLTSHHTF
ncbi:MAG: hypothetical protein OEQ12_05375 [Nitrosopumilus sp.]|nr:hypothetical protein [Nitrosopumilus sp.]